MPMHVLSLCLAAVLGAASTPKDILATFELHPDFQIELVAMEPLVFDPVDLEFDEQGRAYVLEMPGYPLGETAGQVVLLEDTNADGVFDSRRVFARDFPVADSILPWNGGLLVASPPDLIFIKDTTGDGVADVREVLLSGFDVGNTQHNFNGLTHGLDNWIYAASGGNAGEVFWPARPDEKTPIRWNDFRFDLRREVFQRIGASTGGFEITLDDFGRYFATHNMVHASHLVFPGVYLSEIAGLNPNTLHNISDHEESGTARVFPIGEQETRVNHPEQSGYFSGACGITLYNGGAFGEDFQNNLFVCDVVVNIVHRDVLRPSGTSFVASRARDRVEFLASSDRHFRPVNLQAGPDGALYVLDMHRAVIEHPEWIPDEIQQHLDIAAGMDKGRIFRITPKAGLPRVQPAFPREDLAAVVRALGHENRWWRDTAQRLLVEWGDRDAVPLLERSLHAETPQARVHALWTLEGLDSLSGTHLIQALADTAAGVRENAVIIAESRLSSDTVLEKVLGMTGDPDARVRLRAGLALGTLRDASETVDQPRQTALHTWLQHDISDPFARRALLAAAAHAPHAMLLELLDDTPLLAREGAGEILQKLAEFTGRAETAEALATLLARLAAQAANEGVARPTLAGLAEGLGARAASVKDWGVHASLREPLETLLEGAPLPVVREAWRVANLFQIPPGVRQQALMTDALENVLHADASTGDRLANLALLELAPFDTREELLFALLHTRYPREVQTAAMAQLAAAATPGVAARVIAEWKTLSAPVRVQAGNMLLRRREHHDRLLTALETGAIALGEMNFDLERRRTLLWWSGNEDIARRAEKLFSDAGVVTRQAALDQMRPALEIDGDPRAGREVFAENCAKCHVISGEGFNVGPDLTDIFRKSRETLLHDILDPNAAVDTEYISFTIETEAEDVFDVQVLTGMIVAETDASVTLREAGGIEHEIPRARIHTITSTGLSMMPEELEAGLSHQQMADLIAYLLEPR